MAKIHRLFLIVLVALFPLRSIGQGTSDSSKAKKIDQIITATSLSQQMVETAREFHDQFSQNPLGLDSANNAQMMDLFEKAFTQKSMLTQAKETFSQNYNSQYADSVIAWTSSSAGKKVLERRQDSYSLQGIRKRVVNKYEMEKDPPSKERKAVVDSLTDLTSVSESEINANITMFRAVIKAYSQLSDKRTFNDSQIENFVNNYRNQISAGMSQETNQQLMVMLHGLDDETLRKYNSFYRTQAGQWLNKNVKKSIKSAFEAAASHFLDSITTLNSGK